MQILLHNVHNVDLNHHNYDMLLHKEYMGLCAAEQTRERRKFEWSIIRRLQEMMATSVEITFPRICRYIRPPSEDASIIRRRLDLPLQPAFV